jgi:hypothetical protein|tara:strand:+ start:8661 stop:8954 length:294 start_codon:yes stop_codon:yes gene_type:complete
MKNKEPQLRDIQVKIGKDYLYLDVDTLMSHVVMVEEEDGKNNINLPRWEFFRGLLDTLLGYGEEVDNEMGHLALNKTTIPFRLAFNTLIEYNILKRS